MLQFKKLLILFLLHVVGYINLIVRAEPSRQTGLINHKSKTVCPHGFYGPSCEGKCGASCSLCDNQGQCLQCSKVGVQLPECTKACNRGFFGTNCKHRCDDACLNGECDRYAGYCRACRDAGYNLPTCTMPCIAGTYGLNCRGRCPLPCKDNCDHLSGICTQCDVGEGPHCSLNCALTENSQNCTKYCPENCVGWCNAAHKQCSMCLSGYKTPHCREYCDTGTFGSQCNENCSVRCKDKQCNHITGECTKGCIDGYVGRWCNGKCVSGLYGPGCSRPCPETCLNEHCHAETGFCVKCLPGYSGQYCELLCESGKYGLGCSKPCPSKCRSPCDSVTGSCHGCLAGYNGRTCNNTCATGSFGLNCNRTCPIGCLNEICHHETGDCVECKEYFQGPMCKQYIRKVTRPLEIVVYAVISLLTPVVLLAIIIACYKHRSTRENKSIIERVFEAETEYISRPRQKKEQPSRIDKTEIRVVGNSAKISSHNIESMLRKDRVPHRTLQLRSYNPRLVSLQRPQPSERRPTPVKSGEDSMAQRFTHTAPNENKVTETDADTIGHEPTKKLRPDGSKIFPDHELPKQNKISESQKLVTPVKTSFSIESRFNAVPKEQENVFEGKNPKPVKIPSRTNNTGAPRPCSRAPWMSTIKTPESQPNSKTGADISQAFCQIGQTEQERSIARINSAVQNVINTEKSMSPKQPNFSQQPLPNSRLGSENGNVGLNDSFAASQCVRLSQKKIDQQSNDRVPSFSCQTKKPFRVASSPSHFNITQLPIVSQHMSSTQIPMLSQPESCSKRQRTQSSSPHGRQQVRLENTPSLQSEPKSRPFISTLQNVPPLYLGMASRSQSTQSRSAGSQPPRSGPESLTTTERGSVPQNKMSLQRVISAQAQTTLRTQSTTSPPRLNTSEAMSVLPQGIPQSQLVSESYNMPQSRQPISSALKYLSQSEHTMPSIQRLMLPTPHSTVSQHGKSQMLSQEQIVASGPQSTSSLRPNNTLSSILTMPETSESLSGQQHTHSNFNPQGKSSTLTNITPNDTYDPGHNKHLPSTSTSGSPDIQDTEKSEAIQPGGFEAAGSTDINALHQTIFTFSFTRHKTSGSQEGDSAPRSTTEEPVDDMYSDTKERHSETTQAIPDIAVEAEKPGSSKRRKTRQVDKDSEGSTIQKRQQSKSPGLVRCATTRRQVQIVSPESRIEPSLNPLPAPPAQGRAILKPVHKLSRHRVELSSKSSPPRDSREHSQSD